MRRPSLKKLWVVAVLWVASIWKMILYILSHRVWTGLAVIVAVSIGLLTIYSQNGPDLPGPPDVIVPPPPPQPDAAAVEACIAEAESGIEFSRDFSVRGEARCPGGGCMFRSGRCNRRVANASYDSPGSYYLDSYRIEDIETNHGSRGGIEVTSRDAEGRAMGVRVELVCDPPNYPGAPGGWSRATLTGTERLRNEEQRREEIRASCELP